MQSKQTEAETNGVGRGGPDDPIRVCVVAPSPRILGGQAMQAMRLVRGLSAVPGVEVTFLPVDPAFGGIRGRLQRIRYVRTMVTESAYIRSLLREIPRHDVIHIFSASYFSFVLAPTPALLLARAFGRASILNYRSGEAPDHLARWRTAVPTLKLADALAVPSGYLADVFGEFGLSAHVIANVVEPERFRFRHRTALRPVFLANRNFEAHYNVACVLRAFARVRERVPEAQLTVAGDGPQRAALERLSTELGARGVRFVGRVPPEQMPALYDAADIYLNAPDIDNMPGSIIEAFASGVPVVSTDAGGIPYIVESGRTGLLVPRDDDERMADSALRLLEDAGLAGRIGRAAYDEFRTKYRWEAVEPQWLELYRSLTRGRPPVSAASTPTATPGPA